MKLTAKDLKLINSKDGFFELLDRKKINIEKTLDKLHYRKELKDLQAELVKLQNWLMETDNKLLVIYEGRDAAGKGGAIQRFSKHLQPRYHRIVALPKPSDTERGQWYFQRYVNQLPTDGEIVLFDRSWYNRAVVEPVNGFCTSEQYDRFMQQVNRFEKLLVESGLIIVKFWLDITKKEQAERFEDRREDPLKQWKISPVDAKAQQLWDRYTHYKNLMLEQTDTELCPWQVVQANSKRSARLETIRHVLNLIDYKGKDETKVSLAPDLEVIRPADAW